MPKTQTVAMMQFGLSNYQIIANGNAELQKSNPGTRFFTKIDCFNAKIAATSSIVL